MFLTQDTCFLSLSVTPIIFHFMARWANQSFVSRSRILLGAARHPEGHREISGKVDFPWGFLQLAQSNNAHPACVARIGFGYNSVRSHRARWQSTLPGTFQHPVEFGFGPRCSVRRQVSAPQINTGNMHWLHTILFSDRGCLLFII